MFEVMRIRKGFLMKFQNCLKNLDLPDKLSNQNFRTHNSRAQLKGTNAEFADNLINL